MPTIVKLYISNQTLVMIEGTPGTPGTPGRPGTPGE